MSITDAGVDQGRRTLADRFATYLEKVTSPSDIEPANKSTQTVKRYTDTVRVFCMFLVDNGMPTDALEAPDYQWDSGRCRNRPRVLVAG